MHAIIINDIEKYMLYKAIYNKGHALIYIIINDRE